MNYRFERQVTVELVGGLGNQLFQFFAGKYLADKIDAKLLLNGHRIGFHATNHGSHVTSILHNQDFQIAKSRSPKLSAQISRYSEIIERRLLPNSFNRLILKSYNSHTVGFDANLEQLDRSIKLRGYFQSYKYFTSDFGYRKIIAIEKPSSWYESMRSTLCKEDSVVIHIRRGDYTNLKNSFGVLDSNYYKQAILIAAQLVANPTYLVFSDDIDAAQSIADFLPSESTFYVRPPSSCNPAESLCLMSLGKVLVTANSTFSLWSGLLAGAEAKIISPKKWFKAMEDPTDLRPPNWILCPSSWEL